MTQETPTVEEVIKEATNRFLGWKLPEDFAPDCGIEFQKEFNVSYNARQRSDQPLSWMEITRRLCTRLWYRVPKGLPPCKHEPVGTNLLDAQQAEVMVRYILEDVLTTYGQSSYEEGVKAERKRVREWAQAKKEKLTMKWDTDRAKSTVYDAILYNFDGFLSDNK